MPAFPFWPETWQRGYLEFLIPPEVAEDSGRLLAYIENVKPILKRAGYEPGETNVRRPAQKTHPDRGQLVLEDFLDRA